ncbi:hypothetical protein ADK70_31950 [Streptomyces rimosus subsp. pseudoverticillatus]|uniref:winged helix-turn-helix transcriptional regulator n=1 Tax=Streptomyces rimosus TaxID=1927 RepID=UPI0006B266CC|nr:winged helix-turn-helix transcriptional regulator [Streptomyces rimosus]KOT79123.1 hypothetical protein ADK70_31950 [Streptomyces rimosus subsp. pseudoverticillatus]
MAPTGLSRATATDLARVTESLDMIAPRWSVWVLMTLHEQPLRYHEIKPKLAWLADGQLNPRLHKLTDAGLVERGQLSQRHVTYGLTNRGAALMPVLDTLATWAGTHLEKDLVLNPQTGQREPERIPKAQDIEDALGLITPRHATPILWTLREGGTASARDLAAAVLPGSGPTTVYQPLRQLTDDGLVERTAGQSTYQLTAAGRSLNPVHAAFADWAAGRTPARAASGQAPSARKHHGQWATHTARPAMSARPAAASAPATWKNSDLFSHGGPVRPMPTAARGRRR